MTEWWTDYTLRNVTLGAVMLGAFSGILGTFPVLRRQGLTGDAMAHATLPGVCVAFLVTQTKSYPVLMVGAVLAALVSLALVQWIQSVPRVDPGSALGWGLSTAFGLGVVLLGVVQSTPNAGQAGLEKFLMGQASAITSEQVAVIGTVGGLSVLIVTMVAPRLTLATFDPTFAQTQGLRLSYWSGLLNALMIGAIAVGIGTVGVILMSAMLIAPSAAARQWTHRLGPLLVLAGLFGAVGGLFGALSSMWVPRAPTGPAIVLSLSAVAVVSVVFGRDRGLFWSWRRRT